MQVIMLMVVLSRSIKHYILFLYLILFDSLDYQIFTLGWLVNIICIITNV